MCNKIDAFDNSQLINKKVATLIYCYVRAESGSGFHVLFAIIVATISSFTIHGGNLENDSRLDEMRILRIG